ncbi:hypothetical protein KSF_100860 [Reticulibacter mediterranei]|uniref:HTH merR-type domain-containing protein n=1 Tax=Reticulibacter mediterranei TaxID=2778369 RepID=A0A8J3IT65_9CHLR|nr:hypothetical protein KSF_100860 [Reticulibacter mediterranei]
MRGHPAPRQRAAALCTPARWENWKALGLPESTLRYYEQIGLIQSVPRDKSSGHRRYRQDDLPLLEGLAHLRATGMPIEQMREYFGLVPGGYEAAPERLRLLEMHKAALEAEMKRQQAHLQYLEQKIAYWNAILAGDMKEAGRLREALEHVAI